MKHIAAFFARLMKKYLPSAFVLALLLTFVVFVLGLIVRNAEGGRNTPLDLVRLWGDSFWSLLTFAVQMAMIVATGSALASSKAIEAALNRLISKLTTPRQAIVATTLVAAFSCWLHWGFGLILGALFARRVATKVKGVHYPLLVASAYSGYIIWHGGLSGSIPLLVSQPGADIALTRLVGEGASIPLSQTVFSPINLLMVLATLVLLPLLNVMMMPGKDIVTIAPELIEETKEKSASETVCPDLTTPASRIENSSLVTLLLLLLAAAYLGYELLVRREGLTLNRVIFLFFFSGFALHRTPIAYASAFSEGVRRTAGILLQFPLYAGIMGIIAGSGLAAAITGFFVSIADADTLPVFNFIASGIVNFFVPSGGGKWAIESFYIVESALELNAYMPKVIVATSWGDAWTNMAQPFWALPLLSVANLEVKDILGYTILVMLIMGFVYAGILLAF